MLQFRNRVISIHPLFGPRSFNENDLRNVVFVTDISPAGSIKLVKQLFQGFNVIEMTASEHDKLAAKVQVAPYLISILANLVNSNTDLKTRSKKILEMMAGISIEQNWNVLLDTIARNPFSMDILKEIEEKIKQLGGELSDSGSDLWLKH
ncbi:prephenate dehydrogenase [mine drainage metagenome]|uniref:Prephenate dehydrogenase n=1 Tax=mine drainage metagenome TaxID=410659 RepID=T1A5C7_9ZZZZ